MDQMMKSVETPQWMPRSFQRRSMHWTCPPRPDSPFSPTRLKWGFGNNLVKGIAEVKKFFVTFDTPFKTVHNVTRVWQVANAFVMQGSADMLKKGFGPETTFHMSPLFYVIWLDERGKVVPLRCDLPA